MWMEALIRALSILICIGLIIQTSADPVRPCMFASKFLQPNSLNSQDARDKLCDLVLTWDGMFQRTGVGVGQNGLTFDGIGLDERSGRPDIMKRHNFTAPSKESLHLSMLALAIQGNQRGLTFFGSPNSQQPLLDILFRKLRTMSLFHSQYPGYGHFLPWILHDGTGDATPAEGWSHQVPALDNGQMVWSWIAVAEALRSCIEKHGRNIDLDLDIDIDVDVDAAGRHSCGGMLVLVEELIGNFTRSAAPIFYDNLGHVRAVSHIIDIQDGSLNASNYFTANPCGDPCFLDDPYEGELMVQFLCLYGTITDTECDLIWEGKKKKLQAVHYQGDSSQHPSQPLLVQRGWWFSAHEQWKTLMLPYTDVPVAKAVFESGEHARLHYSAAHGLPGLLASTNTPGGNYLSNAGIAALAFVTPVVQTIVTPYGAFPSLLLFPTAPQPLAWMVNMLVMRQMQGPLGTSESVEVNGTAATALVTWDTKVTSDLALCGGVGALTRQALLRGGKYDAFVNRIQHAMEAVFPTVSVPPEQLLAWPTVTVPATVNFTSC